MTSSGQAWTLIALFSNNDAKNWMENSGEWWYDKSVGVGDIASPSVNKDMLSPAFWSVRGRQFKITRSDDPQHTALLQTTGDCLGGKTFRAKITSYGNFRNGQFQTTNGFGQATCNGSLQKATQVGVWCDWKNAWWWSGVDDWWRRERLSTGRSRHRNNRSRSGLFLQWETARTWFWWWDGQRRKQDLLFEPVDKLVMQI